MREPTAARLRDDYLARLDAALRDVPHGLAMEIREGIAEELQGDDVTRVIERLSRLGEPEDIAQEASQATAPAPPVVQVAVAAEPVPIVQRTWFAVVAAVLLGFGTFLVPVAGWIVGVVLVAQSTLWRRAEKVWAVTAPFVVAGLFALTGLVVRAAQEARGDGEVDPLMPAAFDLAWSGLLLVAFVAVPVSGLWLVWRLRGRRGASARLSG